MLSLIPVGRFPLVQPGDEVAALILQAVSGEGCVLEDGDVLVIASKIVALSENRRVRLADVVVSTAAARLAAETQKDPRLVELILRESSSILRQRPGLVIARHRLGLVGANAGIDQSNIDHSDGEAALLLPLDPDVSAARLREQLQQASGKVLGVIISDSMNRPWRLGSVGVAIGSAGVPVLDDRFGTTDLYGRTLQHTVVNCTDSVAAAAVLLMGEAAERTPLVLVRGWVHEDGSQRAADAVRPVEQDLFLETIP